MQVVAVRVVPNVSGLTKLFDYAVPDALCDLVHVGTMVRVELKGRRVAGWVVQINPEVDDSLVLRPLLKVSSVGPPAEVVDLAAWVADRWHGRLSSVLTSASPPTMVNPRSDAQPLTSARPLPELPANVADAFSRPGVTVVRVAPNSDVTPYLLGAASQGNAIVVVPGVAEARHLASVVKRAGAASHIVPRDWDSCRRGGIAFGARSAVWAPVPELAAIVVVDEHDESLQEERNPTWNARDVAIERARQAGVPCVLLSPSPTAIAIAAADRVLTPSRSDERAGWPVVRVADRRSEDPTRAGLYSPQLIQLLRSPGRVVCVLNRKGRAQMLACTSCGELVRTEDGEHLMAERDGELVSLTTDERRPLFCAVCGGGSLKRLRVGIARAREELEALAGEPVGEISSGSDDAPANQRVIVGTEAALHQVTKADVVAFLDFDQELLAPRYRSAEQAMALLIRAARLVGPRRLGGTILVQTRNPDHRVLAGAVRSDPERFAVEERKVRQAMEYPPFAALAEVSGAPAAEFLAPLATFADTQVLGPGPDGRYLVKAATPELLAERINALPKVAGRVRVVVDPPRI